MLRDSGKLTWLEIKIFLREPLGVIGTVVMPVLVFIVLGRMLGQRRAGPAAGRRGVVGVDVPILGAMLIALERRAVARHDHLDLPRRRHPQAAAGDAAASARRSSPRTCW